MMLIMLMMNSNDDDDVWKFGVKSFQGNTIVTDNVDRCTENISRFRARSLEV